MVPLYRGETHIYARQSWICINTWPWSFPLFVNVCEFSVYKHFLLILLCIFTFLVDTLYHGCWTRFLRKNVDIFFENLPPPFQQFGNNILCYNECFWLRWVKYFKRKSRRNHTKKCELPFYASLQLHLRFLLSYGQNILHDDFGRCENRIWHATESW